MTDRQEKILNSALELFATSGYNAVSTSKIAKEAEVSEGLIFRHFKNKQGLLEAVLHQAFEKATLLYEHIVVEQDPREVLRKAITLPFRVEQTEYHFWKLQFKLKWELEISGQERRQAVDERLGWAFQELGYEEPEREVQLLQHVIEGISGGILKEGYESQEPLKEFLLKKYKL